jgi:protein TonB
MSSKVFQRSPFSEGLLKALTRWGVALSLAVSGVLFTSFLINQLITPHEIEKRIYKFLSVDFVRIQPDSASIQEPEAVNPPKEPELPPPNQLTQALIDAPKIPELTLSASPLNAISIPLQLSPPKFNPSPAPKQNKVEPRFDEQLFPLLTPSPAYPHRAKRARIEGWVNISFTIETDGSVSNIQVLSAEPEGIFERSTLKTVAQWKYKPQLLAGKPSARRVVQTINFTLED